LKIIIEIIGWTAAVMMLSAYLLLSSGRLRSLSPAYQWLNLRLKDPCRPACLGSEVWT
jgi:hypothetical protein